MIHFFARLMLKTLNLGIFLSVGVGVGSHVTTGVDIIASSTPTPTPTPNSYFPKNDMIFDRLKSVRFLIDYFRFFENNRF